MKKIYFIVIVGIISFSADLPNAALKKIDKTLAALWENKSLVNKRLNLDLDVEVNKIYAENDFVGYYVLAKANSKADFFNYMVVYSSDMKIMTVQLLVYRED